MVYSLVLKPQIADINYQDLLRGKQGFGRTTEVLSFPSLYSMLACFLVPLWEVINLGFAIEAGHLVRVSCAVGILPFALSQCHTGKIGFGGWNRAEEPS